MKQFDPFPLVSGRFGAPMGRRGLEPATLRGVKKLHARHQGGSEGYDRGGAYWGYPSNVWGVWTKINGVPCVTYIRAGSREDAINQVRNAKPASQTELVATKEPL